MLTTADENLFGLSDVDWFVGQLNAFLFDDDRDVIVTRAPGRLDVMGGIADYSGSLVLEMPIAEATFAAIQKHSRSAIEISTVDGDESSTFEMDIADLVRNGEPPDFASARDHFSKRNEGDWPRYVAGVFFVLGKELGVRFDTGAKIVVASRVPIGKGVSSSAALEVSVMHAVCLAYGIDLAPRDLALLCQTVENHIVGAACGVMDQITSHCGEAGKLTALVCQPAEIRGCIDIPDDIEFYGIDSRVRHAVSGSDYSSVRIGAFMGYRIIAGLAGLDVEAVREGLVEINDTRWNGYLANVSPDVYERQFRNSLPAAMNGQDFLSRYRGTTDPVTSIDPHKTYAIKSPTEHPIYENRRANQFAELMASDHFDEAGKLMFESHESYKACGLTEPRTDRIVELVKENGNNQLFGARITGGGSGGTVAILARRGSRDAIDELAARLTGQTGERPYIFHGSSPGCSLFGDVRLRAEKD